jgi:two-component system sensor histidine kinase PilS (NtrC family)
VGARLTLGDLRGHGVWRSPGTVLLVIGGLTIIYATALRLSRALLAQARIQFTLDIILVTWLIGITNDIHSPYTALYIVIISLASLFLGPTGAVIMSIVCAAAFTGSSLAVFAGYGPGISGIGASLSDTIQSVGLFDVAFFVVGLLAARLGERQSRSDVQLIAATQSLASLRALHERIVESIRSGVVTTDLEGQIYTFNAAAEEITGYKANDVRGQEASILFGDISDDIKLSLQAAEAGAASPRFEATCLTAEGLRLRLGFGIAPLFSESGETTGIVITFQDLTQIRALEDASRRQDRLAAVGRMAASIARSPPASRCGSGDAHEEQSACAHGRTHRNGECRDRRAAKISRDPNQLTLWAEQAACVCARAHRRRCMAGWRLSAKTLPLVRAVVAQWKHERDPKC